MSLPHITVCICTFRRPVFLKRLLEKVADQPTGGDFTFSVVVADNDAERSAEQVVRRFSNQSRIETVYCCEPIQNIALVRNKAIEQARGEFIAFIDDDEFPCLEWLQSLFQICRQREVVAVLGPVRPHFEQPPPSWITRGHFCERPDYPTGTLMDWRGCRTGNVLFRKDVLLEVERPFDERFGNGGEDVEFFMRLAARGHKFVWCNQAVAYETVPPSRWKRRYMLKRALLRGKNGLKLPTGRARALTTSLVAVPLYSLLLLPALIFGQHWFMKYCIRLCDHLGRLLTCAGINPVNER